MQENNIKQIEEDEIDLRELFKTIMKYKKFIVIFTTLVTLGAVAFAFVKIPIYEVSAVIEIGSVESGNNNNNFAIENPNNLVKKLTISYAENQDAFLSNVSVVKNTSNLVEIKVQSSSNIKAQKLLEKILSDIISKHESKIESYTELVKQQISNLSKQKEELELEKNRFEGSMALKFEIASKLSDLSLKISSHNIQPTALIGEIITSDYPIKPKKKPIVIIAFITGLILSIFSVFLIEFIRNEKERSF